MKIKRLVSGVPRSFLLILLILTLAGGTIYSLDRIEKRFSLKADFSFNQATTYGEATANLLKSLSTPVHAYAVFSPGNRDQTLISLLERYSAQSSLFTFSIEDLFSNPTLVHNISSDIDDSAVSSDCLIIHCPGKNRTKILDQTNYISTTYDSQSGQFVASGIQYENSLTNAIAYVTSAHTPSLTLLDGHDELDKTEAASLENLLTSMNYEVKRVNPLRGDVISPDSLLIILSPRKDFSEIELKQIMDYLNQGGSLLITTDHDDPSQLPNFNALLRYFGTEIVPGVVVADEKDTASFYGHPFYLLPYMVKSEITTPLIASGQDTLMLTGARAFTLSNSKDLQLEPLLKSGKATIRPFKDGKVVMDSTGSETPSEYTLALLADKANAQGIHAKAFIIGNSSVFTDTWLYQNTYSTEFLKQTLQTIYHNKPIQLDIPSKPAFRASLRQGSLVLPTLFTALIPLLVVALALIILLPRRRL